MKHQQLLLAALLSAFTLTATSVSALTASETQAIQKAAVSARLPELPALAAGFVIKAAVQDRLEMATVVTKEFTTKHPASAPAIVGAIAKAAPEVADIVAGIATEIVPAQALQIAKAATSAAPAKAASIAAAVVKVTPAKASELATVAITAAPIQHEQIAKAIRKVAPTATLPPVRVEGPVRVGEAWVAHAPVGGGVIVVNPGTISGTTPGTNPTAVTAVQGADPNRPYATP